MWKLTKTMRFEASHRLPDHDGKCRKLHGHSWVVHVTVKGSKLNPEGPKRGMVLDYTDLGAVLDEIHEMLDHTHLNDTLCYPGFTEAIYPTSEELAKWVYVMARHRLFSKTGSVSVDNVVVEETCGARCEYSEYE